MTVRGRIMKGVGGLYTVLGEDGSLYTCPAKGLFRLKGETPYVGDCVELQADPNSCVLTAILPRRTFLARPPIANVDRALFVVSTTEPAPNLFVLDRMLAIAECKGIEPVLIFTKVDLASPDELVRIYRHAGFEVHCVSPELPGREMLLPLLAGHLTVLAGNTGVGKSTLLNMAFPDLSLQTGEISHRLGRGRHTTRQVELYPVEDGLVADTPGFSSWDSQNGEIILKEALPRGFREFAPYVEHCRFTGCSHTKEKDCAILAALQSGDVEPTRHASYRALYDEVKDLQDWELRRRENGLPPIR